MTKVILPSYITYILVTYVDLIGITPNITYG